MTGGGWRVWAAAALLLCACSAKSSNTPAGGQDIGVTDSALAGNPEMPRLDPVSADFCQARAAGPPELIVFLSTVETCDLLTSPTQRAQARCNTLAADEIRLRARFATDGVVLGALNRARSRPWPNCPAVAAAPVEAAADEAGDETAETPPVDASDGQVPPP
ncbi:MAG: hypothetical protein JWM33_815 [Caulobacteraceae bacterium]|nr:hypothetical protein [Caulobacteraceae bacterium]